MLSSQYESYINMVASGDLSDAAQYEDLRALLIDLDYDIEPDVIRVSAANDLAKQLEGCFDHNAEEAGRKLESLQKQRDGLALQEPNAAEQGIGPHLIWQQRLSMADDQLQAAKSEWDRAKSLLQRAVKATNEMADVALMPRHWRNELYRLLGEQTVMRRELARLNRDMDLEAQERNNIDTVPVQTYCDTDLTSRFTKAFVDRKLYNSLAGWDLP